MAYRLPILTIAAAVLLAVSAPAEGQAAGQGGGAESNGGQLLISAARRLPTQALSAKVLHRVELLGRKLEGVGHYQQLGGGSEMARLELKMAIGEDVTSLLQICDGRFVYVRQELPERKTLTRIDLEQVNAALAGDANNAAAHAASNWMALGGLPRLMTLVADHFELSAPRSSKIGTTPVWIIKGNWRKEMLAKLLPGQSEQILAGSAPDLSELPLQVPTGVVVTLGREEPFPLFPYRIEFRRAVNGGAGEGGVTLQFYEVRRRGDLTAQHFDYKPGDQELNDITAAFIANLTKKSTQ